MTLFRCFRRRQLSRLALILALIFGLSVALSSSAQGSPGTGGPIMLAENTAKCVDLDVASGRVQLYDCLGDANQQWTLHSDGSLTTNGACLETPQGQTGNNTLLIAAACTGTENQKWTHDGQELVNAAANRCIDLPNGNQTNQSQLQIYDCLNNPNQQWDLPANAAGWTAAWGSAMQQAPLLTNASNLTCRDIARVTVSGTAIRIRLSNAFVSEPVTFNAVSVAVRDSGGSIVAGTALPVTFNGSPSVTIPAGGEVLSDGVSMLISAGEDIAVSTSPGQPPHSRITRTA